MSDYIPFEIQVEIIKHLPIKPLLQFRSVSKAWKSHIDSSDFITHYHTHHLKQHLLVRVGQTPEYDYEYISIADDHTFPHTKVSAVLPKLVNMLRSPLIVGNSHGLFCLYGSDLKGIACNVKTDMAVIWNPSIRKAVSVVVPNMVHSMGYETDLGFGVCPKTSDPKIIRIRYVNKFRYPNSYADDVINMGSITKIPVQVEVFSLSTGVWRSPYSNLPRESIEFLGWQVALDGFLYWLNTDWIAFNDKRYLILSFDVTSEEFREIDLPDNLALADDGTLILFKLRESLVVVEQCIEATIVWMMEDAVPNSFTKLFNIDVDIGPIEHVTEIRKTGEPILFFVEGYYLKGYHGGLLAIYDPYSKHIDYLGIDGKRFQFKVDSYMETLLLLDHPDLTVYNNKETLKIEDVLFEELNFIY